MTTSAGATSAPTTNRQLYPPATRSTASLVFEAAPGQVVPLDCGVLANPAKSVHFSWFISRGAERNLTTGWLAGRDSGADDEQIDESGPRLRFKIKDDTSFALVKCKAKNEIGLQQRPCLFQLTGARAPALRHTCSLMAAHATSLQLGCWPNEHLKTDQSELLQAATGHLEAQNQWPVGVEAARHQAGSGEPGAAEPRASQLRLVYPPNWLLAELYKAAKPAGAGNSSTGANSQNHDYELAAYIVVGSGHQLARIKSIVEDNKLFRTNPKDVYYVAAKQHQELGDGAPTSGSAPARSLFKTSSLLQSKLHSSSQHHQQASGRPAHDETIQLADTFNFTVPSLEPDTRYKLLIYGQNLANKTRDWLVVRGETPKEEPQLARGHSDESVGADDGDLAPAAGRPQQADGDSMQLSAEQQQQDQSAAANVSLASQQQKSLVMRSETDPAKEEPHIEHLPNGGQLASERGPGNQIDLLLNSNSTSAGPAERQLHQLAIYKDYAIYYARQKPLLAVPVALGSVLVLVLAVVWLAGLLVGRMRHMRLTSSGSGSGSNHCPAGSGPGSATHKSAGADHQLADQMHRRQSVHSQLMGADSPNDSYASSARPDARAAGLGSSSSPTDAKLSSTAALLAAAGRQNQPELAYANHTVYALDQAHVHHSDILDAIALGQVYGGQTNKLYALDQPASSNCALHQRHLLGSLDRRLNAGHEPVYLAEPVAASNEHWARQLAQLGQLANQAAAVGSIDRRAACTKQHYRSLFVPADWQATGASCQEDLATVARYAGPPGSNGSSSECSSHESQAARLAQRVQRAQQHVAFDLTNQSLGAKQEALGDKLAPARRHILCGPARAGPAANCADSANSNSANTTADSGHESPPTGDLNSLQSPAADQGHLHAASCPLGRQRRQGHQQQQQQSTAGEPDTAAGLAPLPGARGRPQPGAPQGCPQHALCHLSNDSSESNKSQATTSSPLVSTGSSPKGGQRRRQVDGNVVMLMGLSAAGSQESASLLQSVGSIGELALGASASSMLHQNHRMATSFATGGGARLHAPAHGGLPAGRGAPALGGPGGCDQL